MICKLVYKTHQPGKYTVVGKLSMMMSLGKEVGGSGFPGSPEIKFTEESCRVNFRSFSEIEGRVTCISPVYEVDSDGLRSLQQELPCTHS